MNKTKVNAVAKRIFKSAEKNQSSCYWLTKAFKKDGKYIFLDGYRIVRLNQQWELPLLTASDFPKTIKGDEDKARMQSQMTRAYGMLEECSKEGKKVNLPTLGLIKQRIKDYKQASKDSTPLIEIEVDKGKAKSIWVNANYLKDMIELFGEDVDCYRASENHWARPLYFVSADGDGALLPVSKR